MTDHLFAVLDALCKINIALVPMSVGITSSFTGNLKLVSSPIHGPKSQFSVSDDRLNQRFQKGTNLRVSLCSTSLSLYCKIYSLDPKYFLLTDGLFKLV